MKEIKKILIHRLSKKGIGQEILPGFIRILANSIFTSRHKNLLCVNKRLRYLGWNDFELDEHTFQLALACFEAEGLGQFEIKPANWFKENYMAA